MAGHGELGLKRGAAECLPGVDEQRRLATDRQPVRWTVSQAGGLREPAAATRVAPQLGGVIAPN